MNSPKELEMTKTEVCEALERAALYLELHCLPESIGYKDAKRLRILKERITAGEEVPGEATRKGEEGRVLILDWPDEDWSGREGEAG